MTSVSKHQFDSARDFITCRLLHPHSPECWKSVQYSLRNGVIGSLKFNTPIYLLQAIFQWKNAKNLAFWKKHFKGYFKSMLYTTCFMMIFIYSNCIMGKIARAHYYACMIAAIFSGSAIFLESEENKTLDTIIFLNQFIENVILYLDENNIFKRNRLRETSMFMALSGSLMYLLEIRNPREKFVNFWFYHHAQKRDPKVDHSCYHRRGCPSYCFKGFYSYFLVGYVVQAIKSAVSRIAVVFSNPMHLQNIIFARENILLGLFLGSFVGAFRGILCMLRRKYGKQEAHHVFIAGLVAGASYYFKPSLTMTAIASSTLIQIFLLSKQNSLKKISERLPLKEVGFCLLTGFLFHHRIHHAPSSPNYVKKMITIVTNRQLDKALANYFDIIKSVAKQSMQC